MENLFFNKGLISGLILWDRETSNIFFRKHVHFFYKHIFLDEQNGLPRILATIVNLTNIAGALTSLDNFGHNSEPRH